MRDEFVGLKIIQLGLVDYLPVWQAMKDFTAARTGETADEIWLLQHPPVYTQGVAGKPEHLLHNNGIEVIRIDRGGQITYHGPGQIIAYLLLTVVLFTLLVVRVVGVAVARITINAVKPPQRAADISPLAHAPVQAQRNIG